MDDRNVQYPNRFQLTKVDGTDDIYEIIPAPGEVYTEGTFINKFALLKDTTAALYGLGADAVPDDVLAAIKTQTDNIATGSYVGTGTYGASNPCSLTFPFVPQFFWVYATLDNSGNKPYTLTFNAGGSGYAPSDDDCQYEEVTNTASLGPTGYILPLSLVTTSYSTVPFGTYGTRGKGISGKWYYSKIVTKSKFENKTLSWYSSESSSDASIYAINSGALQFNSSGITYYWIAVV